MIEEWKVINEFEDYQISNLGRVKSFNKYRNKDSRILKLQKCVYGYHHVTLCKNRYQKIFKVHRLVLTYFKPILNLQDYQCNHIDGNKLNNNINNLEWCTGSENMIHAYRTGLEIVKKGKDSPNYGKHHSEETKKKMSESHLYIKGERNPRHKLTEFNIIEIRKLLKEDKLSQEEIGKMFKIDQTIISKIKLNQIWKCVP